MVIGIDIDDTLTETSKIARENLAKFDSNYTDYHQLPPERYVEYMHLYQADGLKNATLKDGVKEAFDYLNENGYKIVIITARSNKYDPRIKDLTLEYLKRHNLKYSKIIFEKDEKGKIASKEHVKLFIDDKETVLDNVATYNIDTIKMGGNVSSKHKTFSNWSDIINYIKTRKG